MYCKYCGKPIDDGQRFCGICGGENGMGKSYCGKCGKAISEGQATELDSNAIRNASRAERWILRDKISILYFLAGFFFPAAGFIFNDDIVRHTISGETATLHT